jgi:hypothetical protein
MSVARRQVQIAAPPEKVWELVGDPARHPEWFPRVLETHCEGIEEGCAYRVVARNPFGVTEEEDFLVEQFADCDEIKVRCLDTGTYMRFALTEAQGGTFVDAEFGMEPVAMQHKVFDRLAGKRFYRNWLDDSLAGLRVAAETAPGEPRGTAPA